MILAVASGKGGTGKTTVAVNLALCLPTPVRLLDCDVEEPNCHIFLKPEIREIQRCCLPVPIIDDSACNGCGDCSRMCQYNAIVTLKGHSLVFPDLCHGCGGCARVCPVNAIAEGERKIGVVEVGRALTLELIQGRLKVGQAMSPPLIRAVKRHTAAQGITVVDCPPGTSCPVITAVQGSDFVVLVTEPTPFGLHDLQLAVDTMRRLALDFGVIINRADAGDSRVVEYCGSEHIPILMEIPEDRRVAEAYSRGQLIMEVLPEMRSVFSRLGNVIYGILQECGRGTREAERGVAG